MNKRQKVLLIAEGIVDLVETEVDDIDTLLEQEDALLSKSQTNQMKMLHAIFKMTSMSTLLQATKLALDMEEEK